MLDMNLLQMGLAHRGYQLTRLLPSAPPVWTINDGVDFNFAPVTQPCAGLFTVTTSTGRFHVRRGPVDQDHWFAWKIGAQAPALDGSKKDTAAEVIAFLFTEHNPDQFAQFRKQS